MTPEQRERAVALFEAALALPTAQQAAFLEAECPDDAAVREQVRTLLERDRKAGNFLKTLTIVHQLRDASSGKSSRAFQPGQLVAERYRIQRFLQAGGMGEVYAAEDLLLRQEVALKTVLPELAGQGRILERFKREIALSRRVTHPNVCRVYDVGRHLEVIFLSMELLSGETLAEYLAGCQQRRLSTQEALPLARQMADGLAAAHDVDVIHRDFKPGNVILTKGQNQSLRAVITDFGIAQYVPESPLREPFTETGVLVGTPEYMAPEQFERAPASIRTDIYAFGLVLYEMIAGRHPFGPGPPARQAVNRRAGPPSPKSIVPDLDLRWEKTILRCLARDPEQRFASPRQVIAALDPTGKIRTRRAAFTYAAWVAGVGGAASLLWREKLYQWLAALPEERHVAVLPFTLIGGSARMQVFAEGLMESLTSRLAALEQFQHKVWFVPASEIRGSKVQSASEARKAFRVNLAVTGSLQDVAGALRLVLNLIDAGRMRQLDSRQIAIQSQEAASLPDRAVAELAAMLQLRTGPARRIGSGATTTNPEAYRLYEEGLGYLRRFGAENVVSAIARFEKAVALDASYALAYARLGEAYWRRYFFYKNREDVDLAMATCRRAAALSGNLGAVFETLGLIDNGTGKHASAVEHFKKALELDPVSVEALTGLARAYERLGKLDLAEQTHRRATEIRPESWLGYNQLGNFYARHGRYELAEKQFALVAALIPDSVLGHENVGAMNLYLGRYAPAEQALRRALAIRPSANAYSNLSTCALFQGQPRQAVALLEKATTLDPNDHRLWRNLGDAHRALAQWPEKARDAYRRAIELAEKQFAVNPNSADLATSLALYWAKLSDNRQAMEYLAKAPDAQMNATYLYRVAVVHELLHHRQRALTVLASAVQKGYSVEQIQRDPELAELRKDPRFRLTGPAPLRNR